METGKSLNAQSNLYLFGFEPKKWNWISEVVRRDKNVELILQHHTQLIGAIDLPRNTSVNLDNLLNENDDENKMNLTN